MSPHSAPADFDSRCEEGISILPTTGNSDYVTVQQASSGCEPPTHFIQNGGYISVNEAKQQLSPANGSYITVSQAKNNAIIVWTLSWQNYWVVQLAHEVRSLLPRRWQQEKDENEQNKKSLWFSIQNITGQFVVKSNQCPYFWHLGNFCLWCDNCMHRRLDIKVTP